MGGQINLNQTYVQALREAHAVIEGTEELGAGEEPGAGEKPGAGEEPEGSVEAEEDLYGELPKNKCHTMVLMKSLSKHKFIPEEGAEVIVPVARVLQEDPDFFRLI